MKKLTLISVLGIFLILHPSHTVSAINEHERKAVWAGKFYPSEPDTLGKTIAGYLQEVSHNSSLPEQSRLKAVVMPHAGYVYSGSIAAHSAKLLENSSFSKVLLLGPDHRVGFQGCSTSREGFYSTPLGKVFIHEDTKKLLENAAFNIIDQSNRNEHCLEVIVPFLQYTLDEFKLVPVVVGDADPQDIADALIPYMDDTTLVVVSTDFSHYLTYNQAVKKDLQTLDLIVDFQFEQLLFRDNAACGKLPLLILMHMAKQLGWSPRFLKYLNSGDTSGDKSGVVGYASLAWYKDGEKRETTEHHAPELTEQDGKYLVMTARKAITEYCENQTIPSPDSDDFSEAVTRRCGTFVTITKNDRLRGCIGHIIPQTSLLESIRDNALRAAFNDPRFAPVKKNELNDLSIEVSVLSLPQKLSYEDGSDLIRKLRPNIDGVIVKDGRRQATFLPQVWRKLPDPNQFLSRLCQKAGLPEDTWRNNRLAIYTYQVQSFHEEK